MNKSNVSLANAASALDKQERTGESLWVLASEHNYIDAVERLQIYICKESLIFD